MEPLVYDEKKKVLLPQPDDIPRKDREHAAGAYIMMFASSYLPLPLVNLIAAFIYHMVSRKRSRFVAFHTYQSFISQILTSLSLWGLIIWILRTMWTVSTEEWGNIFTLPVLMAIIVILVWNLVYTIISIIAYRYAGKGRFFYLPLFGKHAFNRYFGPNALPATDDKQSIPAENKPPSGA